MKYDITKIDPGILDIADHLDCDYSQEQIDQLVYLLPFEVREKLFKSIVKNLPVYVSPILSPKKDDL